MLKINEKQLVEILQQCQPGLPPFRPSYRVGHNGEPYLLPEIGGITLNVQVGDSVFNWAGDHVEPGVSCTSNSTRPFEHPNPGLQFYCCVGNEAVIISGKAKGAKGTVIGHHGGSEHVIIDFSSSVKSKMTYDDKIIVKAVGQGLQLLDFPSVKVFNLDPRLLKKMNIQQTKQKTLKIPVTTIVPAYCMGSGVGAGNVATGDYDIMTSDPQTVKDFKLDRMKFGDFVALLDQDNCYGRTIKKGAISIGIVVHSDCLTGGHGPGVTTLLTCANPLIEPVIDPKANIGQRMSLHHAVNRARKKK